jgi:hypothetical protein
MKAGKKAQRIIMVNTVSKMLSKIKKGEKALRKVDIDLFLFFAQYIGTYLPRYIPNNDEVPF